MAASSGRDSYFGAVKRSGIGREGSPQGIDDCIEIKQFSLGDIQKQPITGQNDNRQ